MNNKIKLLMKIKLSKLQKINKKIKIHISNYNNNKMMKLKMQFPKKLFNRITNNLI